MPKSVKRFADDIMLSNCELFRQMAIVCRRRKSPGPGRTRDGHLSIAAFLNRAMCGAVKVDSYSLE